MATRKSPFELMRAKVATARHILFGAEKRPLRDRDLDNVINHLKEAVWAWDTYRREGQRARVVIVKIAEAIIDLHFACVAENDDERYFRIGAATSTIVDAHEALQPVRRKT
jgi:hypothetical protein